MVDTYRGVRIQKRVILNQVAQEQRNEKYFMSYLSWKLFPQDFSISKTNWEVHDQNLRVKLLCIYRIMGV